MGRYQTLYFVSVTIENCSTISRDWNRTEPKRIGSRTQNPLNIANRSQI